MLLHHVVILVLALHNYMMNLQFSSEGVTGTVYPEERSFQDKLWQPEMVSVVWDTGVKAQYRAGPLGSFDLRVINSLLIQL